MEIRVTRPTEAELAELGVKSWPIWECRPSTFDWHYDHRETCYVLAGRVVVEFSGGSVEIGAGDLVVFPEGLDCVWNVSEAIKKHYRFG